MDNIKIQPKPFPLEQSMKLKVYATFSAKKTIVEQFKEAFAGKDVMLTLSAHYDLITAKYGVENLMTMLGEKPEDWKVGLLSIGNNIEDLLDINAIVKSRIDERGKGEKTFKKEKTIDDMCAHVKYIFEAGTEIEKKVAERVIKKFKNKV